MLKPYYEKGGIAIYNDDCLNVMRSFEARSFQCFVTSPPYDNMRDYDGYNWDFQGVSHELKRVMCDGGIGCWIVGDSVVDGSETLTSFRQAIHFKDVTGFRVHDTMIYNKLNFSRPDNVRYPQLFEYVFVLSNGNPRCFNPIRDKRNVTAGRPAFGRHTKRNRDGSLTERPNKPLAAEFGIRGNVWTCKTAGQENVCKALPHPAMMPFGLCRDLILSWSNRGDIVLDPFLGSGTTGVACIQTGRRCVGVEISEEYCEIAAKRLELAFAHPAAPPMPNVENATETTLPLLEKCR